jgi:hypothetical protein
LDFKGFFGVIRAGDGDAELTARKKQYHYYRDQLLSFDEGEVEWKALGEVAIIGTGSRNTNESILNGKYPLHNGKPSQHHHLQR